jgi:chromosome segregation ATPase
VDEVPELRRSLFGYRKRDVESILEARERMFERVSEEATQRQIEAEQLRTDLGKAREEARAATEDERLARAETESVRDELTAQTAEITRELETARGELTGLDEQRRDAETRAGGLESEVREARREVAGLTERLRVADATEADLRTRLEQASAATTETRELGSVLEATQDAIERILGGARRTAEEDLARVQHTREQIQIEIDRVRSWQERIDPVARGVADEISAARAQMAQTAERVGEALQPMSDALTALARRLDELTRAADPSTVQPAAELLDRVDLVSHERAEDDRPDGDQSGAERDLAAREAPAGTPFHADPWPDPWR